jgi:hypothetical protein
MSTDLDALLDGVFVRACDHGPLHMPIVRELTGGDHVRVRSVEVCGPRRDMPIPVPVVGLHSRRCHRARCRQGLACGCSEGVSLAIGGCEGGGTALTRAPSCDMG